MSEQRKKTAGLSLLPFWEAAGRTTRLTNGRIPQHFLITAKKIINTAAGGKTPRFL